MNFQAAALEIKQAPRAAEIMQQMAIDVKEIGILAHASDDMLVPDLGQQSCGQAFPRQSSLWLLKAGGISR